MSQNESNIRFYFFMQPNLAGRFQGQREIVKLQIDVQSLKTRLEAFLEKRERQY